MCFNDEYSQGPTVVLVNLDDLNDDDLTSAYMQLRNLRRDDLAKEARRAMVAEGAP
jgi:hypothetical protein